MRLPRALVALLGLLIAVAIPARASAAETALCRSVRQPKASSTTPAFRPYTHLRVRDRIVPGGRTVDVRKAAEACFPVGLDGAGAPNDATPLTGYRTHPSRTKPAQPRLEPFVLDVDGPWGTESLRVAAVDDLIAPATITTSTDDPGPAPGLSHLACYEARARRKASARVVHLAGSGAPPAVEITRPLRVCVTADLGGDDPDAPGKHEGWLCFAARLPRTAKRATDDPWQADTLVFRDRFGRTAMTLGAPTELCVAVTIGAPIEAATATATPAVTATPSPLPTPSGPALISIRVEPPHVVRKPGESYDYVAIGTYEDGSQRNVTEEVEWSCETFLCRAPNEPGHRGRVVADEAPPSWPATFDVDQWVGARDPVTGIESPAVRFEISTSPVPLLIHPTYTIIRERTYDYLTALALDQDGAYRNATQDVVWTSSDPSVAAATNVVDFKSRIDGVGPGRAEIRATDPRSGAVSDPAVFEVFGPLVGIEVRTRGRTIAQRADTLEVGEEVGLRAWGFFDQGFPFEGFEPVTFTVENPAVAVAEPVPGATPNAQPNGVLARVLRGTAPGVTRVSARDELTGVDSHDRGCDLRLTVREPATTLRLSPNAKSVGLGELVKPTALGVGTDGATRNWTQRVAYASSDPSVAYATNQDGDRSRIVVVGPGQTVISAVDPVTGLATTASGNLVLTVRNEHADRLDLTPTEIHVPMGTYPRFSAVAHYPSGITSPVNESVTWSSNAPDVATFDYLPDRRRLYPRQFGTATVTAALPSLGLTSSPGTLVVEPVAALTVVPSTATIAVGAERTFSVEITLASGATVEVGKDRAFGEGWVSLRSSDRNVARDADSCWPGQWIDVVSPVLGVAPGTAVVAAQGGEPAASSTATGGDAILTVSAP